MVVACRCKYSGVLGMPGDAIDAADVGAEVFDEQAVGAPDVDL